MQINVTAKTPVTVITKNATPYEVDGNKGITYRLVVMMGNDVEKVKCTDEDVYNGFEPGKNYLLNLFFNVYNGRSSEPKVTGGKQG